MALFLRLLLLLFAGVVAIIILVMLALQFPAVQTSLADRATRLVSARTDTHVSIDRVGIRIPQSVRLYGLYVEDHDADTLAYVGVLNLDLSMVALLRNKVHIKHLELADATMNLLREQPDTLFNLDRLLLSIAGPKAGEEISTEAEPPDELPAESATPWTFEVGSVWLRNIRFRYADHFDGSSLALRVGAIRTRVDVLDPAANAYKLGDTYIGDLFFHMHTGEGSRPPGEPPESPAAMPEMGIGRLIMENAILAYHEQEGFAMDTQLGRLEVNGADLHPGTMRLTVKSLGARGLDLAMDELDLSGMGLQLDALFYDTDSLSVHIASLSGKMNAFSLSRLSGHVHAGRGGSSVQDLVVESGQSRLKASLATSMPLLAPQLPPGSHHSLQLDVGEAVAGPDLVHLFPEARMLFPDQDAPPIHLLLSASGRLGDLWLDTLDVEIPGRLVASTAGRVSQWPETDSMHFHIPRLVLEGHPATWMAYLPPGLLAQDPALHGHLEMEAAFMGQLSDFEARTLIRSDMASLAADFVYKEEGGLPVWQSVLSFSSPDPLAVVGQEGLIKDLYLSLEGQGTGFQPESMEMEGLLRIDSALFNGYRYRGLELALQAGDARVGAKLAYGDEHLRLSASNELLLGGDDPLVEMDWQLDHLNLQALAFSEELIALQTKLSARMAFRQDDFPDGWLKLKDTHVLLDREVFSMDSLVLNTSVQDGQYGISLRAPFLRAIYQANVHPASLPGIMSAHLGGYLEESDEGGGQEPGRFRLSLEISPSPYVSEVLLPQIQSYDTVRVEARFDAGERDLMLDIGLPDLVVAGWHLQNLEIRGESDPQWMDLNLNISYLDGHQLSLRDIGLDAHLADHALSFDLSFADLHNNPWLALHGELEQKEGVSIIRFGEEMLLNRQPWRMAPSNELRLLADNLLVRDLHMETDGKAFSLSSKQYDDPDSSLELMMKAIDLGQFDLLGDAPLVEGIFDGRVELWDLFTTPVFTADLSVAGLGLQGEVLGDLHLLVDSPEPGLFMAEADMSGYGNRIAVSGLYRQGEPDFIDFNLMVDKLEMSAVEALTMEQLKELEGHVSGHLHLRGDPSRPAISGNIGFHELSFFVPFLNLAYRIHDERILFDDGRISFSHFTLLDRSERSANLDGHIDIHTLSDIRFDLRLDSDNFLLMDLPRENNELFFGRMLIDTRLRLRGDLASPVLEGSIKLNQGSSLSVIPPQTEPEAIGDEGVVEFISIADELFADLMLRPDEPQAMMSVFENLDMSVNVEIDPQTEMRILLDEVAGDFLEVRGGGLISYGVDPGGRISLSGRYEISQGAYQMTFYDVIRRNFSIEGGSSIVWTGDPLDATVDIAAKYTVRTSVRELMASHAPAAGQQEAAFRQIYPFEVFLRMSGELMRPEISFEIALPPEHRGAMEGRLQARLADLNNNESELNKQVFALLVLGSFIQDDPLAAMTAGPGLTSTARNSASRILSQQLNRLSDRYIRGVDIRFDLESYEQMDNGQLTGRTELQMEVSRDFLDQRLRITAGGHLELEDETRRQVNPADIAGDFSVEYLLDPAGRFTLKGFRERKFQDVFDNEVIETGLSLTFRQTFNDFRELFFRREEESTDSEP